MAHFLAPWLRDPGRPWALQNTRTGRLVAARLEGAFDSASRRRGLLARGGVGEGSALVLAPCSAVHTFGMRFPLDLVFVRRDGWVLKACPAVPPWRVRLVMFGFAVVEAGAGTIGRAGLEPGDVLALVDPGEPPAHSPAL